MKPKELTPEEVIEALCGKKEYYKFGDGKKYLKERFEATKFSAWTREHYRDPNRVLTIELKIPKKCTGVKRERPRCKCKKCAEETQSRFEMNYHMFHMTYGFTDFIKKLHNKICKKFDLHFSTSNLGDDALWMTIPNVVSTKVADILPHGFTIIFEEEYFHQNKQLAIDLLTLYLEAHKDCCTW